MGKRKRSSHENHLDVPSSSDDMPCSSGTKLLSKEHSSNLDAGLGVGDSSAMLHKSNSSIAHRHYNLGHSIFLKRSRHHYGHHYSRRNSGSLASPSTSRGKNSHLDDERLSFKFTQYNTQSRGHADGREKAFSRAERIRSSSLASDAGSPDKVHMVCGVCQKHLRRKPYFPGNTLASGEFSVVSILVCGHVYHADCLEERTSHEDRRDPPCPLCSDSLSQV